MALLACTGGQVADDRPTTPVVASVAPAVLYQDADLDGYGDPATGTMSAPWEAGWTTNATDCDDRDPLTFPGAVEICDNGRDNDCDPATPPDVSLVAPLWYVDADHDGSGDRTRPVQSCQPDGNAPAGDDCDDADPASFPGNPEICDQGIDNDCDPRTDEATTALWYLDADHDGYGVDLDPIAGCNPPAGYVQRTGDCDDDDTSLNPTVTPDCVQTHCGTIASSETWKSTVRHHVTCEVVVEGPSWPVLTLLDGVDVLFDTSTGLRVGTADGGSLVVLGDLHGVSFASSDPFPAPGDWDGLTIGLEDRGTRITGLRVVNGGRNGKGGVVVEGGSPRFDRLTSRANSGHGLYVTGSEPLVHDSRLVDNIGNGLYVAEGAGLARIPAEGGVGPSFTDNVVTGNGLPITVPGSFADEIAPTNVLYPNTVGEIELLSGTLRTSGVWYNHQLPYRVVERGKIWVREDPHAELVIEDGVRVYFGVSAELAVGDGGGGRLDLDEGPEGILFSGTVGVVLSRSHWDGVRFGVDDTGSIVRNLTIEHGGANGKGNLSVNGSGPLFEGVTSRYSDTAGLYVAGSDAAPTVHNCAFVENDEHGVFVESGSGLARSPFGPSFRNNLMTGNGETPIVVPPNFLGELDVSSEFTGNGGRIGVHGGRVLHHATWRRLDEDYQIRGPVEIGGPDDPVVTIEDDVGLWFDRDTVLTAGVADDGALLVEGVQGVVMTSSLATPAEGDWQGLEIGRNGEDEPQTTLSGLTVSYAGGSDLGGGGAIEILDQDACDSLAPLVALDDLTIVASSKAGVFAEAQTRFSAENIVVADAFGGCWDVSGGDCPDPDVVAFTDNDCQSATFGIWPLSRVEVLDETSTYPGPIVLEGTTVVDDLVMPSLGVPFRITGLVKVEDPTAPVLTVAAGSVLEFGASGGLEVGVGEPGGLVVEPEVLLTSPTSVPWLGVKVGRHCTTVSLTGVTLAYPGANTIGGLWVDRCENTRLDAVHVTDASGCAVYVDPRVRAISLTGVRGDVCR